MKKLKLHWQILIAIGLAVIAGLSTSPDTKILGISPFYIYEFLGTLFLNGLKMIIVPLIVSSIIVGVSGISNDKALGELGGKTIGYYFMSSLVAIMIGLLVVNITQPGIIDGEPAKDRLALSDIDDSVRDKVEGKDSSDIAEVFIRMVPPNIVEAAAENQMLGLIFFALLFGYFMMKTEKPLRETLFNFWQGVFETMMKITLFVMKFAPLGVFGLVAKTVASTGFDAFKPLLIFFFTVAIALAIHMFVALPIVLSKLGGVSPKRHFNAMSPAILTAFSTASSSATLPLTMDCVEKKAGVSKRTTSFVLPLGATINMDGTALYECVAAMFIAQAYGMNLDLATQFTIVLVALLTSIGVAGIPAASLVAISIILGTIGLPLEAVGLILVTDRILDMCRTAVNVFSDSCAAVVIGKSQGEEQILTEASTKNTA
ncbi:MAG: dicarboxylate/amino acid:cation symporter [Pseudomonadota bacterium]